MNQIGGWFHAVHRSEEAVWVLVESLIEVPFLFWKAVNVVQDAHIPRLVQVILELLQCFDQLRSPVLDLRPVVFVLVIFPLNLVKDLLHYRGLPLLSSWERLRHPEQLLDGVRAECLVDILAQLNSLLVHENIWFSKNNCVLMELWFALI